MSSATSGEDDAITVPLPMLTALPERDELTSAAGRHYLAASEPHPARPTANTDTAVEPSYEPPPTYRAVSPFAPKRRRRRLSDVVSGKIAAALASTAVVVLAAALILHFAGGPGREVAATTTTAPAETAPQIADQTRLVVLLSSAFRDAMSCQPGEANPAGTLASVHCAPRGQRPDAPAEATYRLVAQMDGLDVLLKAALDQTTVQLCPGNILSPGPWHMTSSPNAPSGTVFCGTRGAVAVVGWTDADKLTFAEIRSAPMSSPTLSGPALAGLYQWWQLNAYRS